jgi:hypothetical protein
MLILQLEINFFHPRGASMKKIPFMSIEVTDEPLVSNTGLAVIGQLMRIAGIDQVCSSRIMPNVKISDIDILKTQCGLLALGKTGFDHVRLFEDEPFFVDALDIERMPKEAAFRQRLAHMSQDRRVHEAVAACSVRLLRKVGVLPELITISEHSFVRVDTDTSIFDNSQSKKEGVEKGYTGVDGYAPICSFLEGGLVVGAQLRPGAQNALHEGYEHYFASTRQRVHELFPENRALWVADAAFDDSAHMSWVHTTGDCFIIKRNPRRESEASLIQSAKDQGLQTKPRAGKTIYTGEINSNRGNICSVRLVYEVTERTIKKGQLLLVPEYTVFSVWTNLPEEVTAEKVLELYRARGTCEQYFAEIKSELDLERLPSGKFSANELFFQLGMFVNNMLRVVGANILSCKAGGLRRATRRRLRTVMQNVMYLCGRVVKHARRVMLKVKSSRGFGLELCNMYAKYCLT